MGLAVPAGTRWRWGLGRSVVDLGRGGSEALVQAGVGWVRPEVDSDSRSFPPREPTEGTELRSGDRTWICLCCGRVFRREREELGIRDLLA